MKFLGKKTSSQVLCRGLTYKKGRYDNNRLINKLLLTEQKNFCAYTEKYLQELDSSEVEHFDSSKKYSDDYYNYYAVIRKANLYKKDEQYVGASFFTSLFFQNDTNFNERVRYSKGGIYEETDESDQEAIDLIDFLGFNDPNLYKQRKRHIARLKRNFNDASYNVNKRIQYFREHKEDLSFVTAIEVELGLNLSEFY